MLIAFPIFRPHRRTRYVDAAYYYRPSSVVCLNVGRSVTAVSLAKTAEPIEMPFGIWTRVSPRNHVLGGVHTSATCRIPLKRPCAAAMRSVVKLLWPLVVIHCDEVNYSVPQYSTHCRTDRRNAGCQSIRLSTVELVPGTQAYQHSHTSCWPRGRQRLNT